ncbi:MAG TPA: substrate-binding domain-containing protein [Micromonosporaceae bacterium]|nr:substrate-binding domain-containing protein [Micromonosporaceae bacterium]
MPAGDKPHRSAPPLSLLLASTAFGAVGSALQQLAFGWPTSQAGWSRLIVGSVMVAAVGLLVAGLFDHVVTWLKIIMRSRLLRIPLAVVVLCSLALVLGLPIPKVADSVVHWIGGCRHATEVRLLASLDQLDSARHLVNEYEQKSAEAHHGCPQTNVHVYAASSRAVREGIAGNWQGDAYTEIGPRPDLWLADSSAEVQAVEEAAQRYGTALSIKKRVIAASPIVLGVPSTQVDAGLHGERRSLGWARLWTEAEKRGWNIVRPDPAASVVGEMSTFLLYAALGDGPGRIVEPVRARAVEQRIERSLDAGGYPLGLSTEVLCHQRRAGAPGAAVITTEQALVRYNAGLALGGSCGQDPDPAPPESSLIGFYPRDTRSVDLELVRLTWDQPDSRQARAAQHVDRWLAGQDGSRALVEAGLRSEKHFRAEDPLTARYGAQPAALFPRPPPGSDAVAVAQVMARYADARRPGRVLLALDTSGSMGDRVGAAATRLELAIGGVRNSLDLMGDRDQFGLWTFPAEAGGNAVREVIPLGRGDVPVNGVPRRHATLDAAAHLKPAGATPLYAAIAEGVGHLTAGREQGVTALVVLTDGSDTAGEPPGGLVATVRGRGVRVFVIAIGQAHCGTPVLRQVADHTGGACYESGPAGLVDTLTEVHGLLWGGDAKHDG